MQIATSETWYESHGVGDGVTWIFEPHIKEYYRCNIWHIRGRDRDLLVDSGMGVVSLREQIPLLSGRPILAVASHTHFDHIGTHHEFAERAVHPEEAEVLAHPSRTNTVAGKYVTDDSIFTQLPPGQWAALHYEVMPAPATLLLTEGGIVDTGDRNFEVFHLPGHSPGSIALYERATGILFAGDVVYDGELAYDAGNRAEMQQYAASMKRLLDLPVQVVHGGHFRSFGQERLRVIVAAFLTEFDQ
ncbi:MAG TPA: MBL fold metallo-hydrolase [Dongiaceae bacterium]|jgi:glyoxylase-like metal-dependent hydrolase (beta-lactamase superfamily II)